MMTRRLILGHKGSKIYFFMRLKSSLVYKFSCAQCASEYVGMTARILGTRVDEHVWVSYRTRARLIRQYVIIEIVEVLHLTPLILTY